MSRCWPISASTSGSITGSGLLTEEDEIMVKRGWIVGLEIRKSVCEAGVFFWRKKRKDAAKEKRRKSLQ